MSKCTCPVCQQGARWSLMRNGRVCVTCTAPACGIQLFARSDDADERIRERFILGDGAPERTERNVTDPAPERTALSGGGLMQWEV
ncbi:hypothetical protein [Cupriavidus basilensis]|uniref:hypothetical protein n=1 Tax=Cupriavidus basilensis TaxID=68895 RepID=UPI0007510FFB|nr:hypothetical protein [Cupriavidus basilensis]